MPSWRLYSQLLDDDAAMAAFAYQLENRDLKDYAGTDPAPVTAAKTQMAEVTRDDLEHWFDDQISKRPLRPDAG
jgi:hypothetical protein